MAAVSSTVLAASGSALARPGQVVGVVLTPAAAAATVTIYDNPSGASGTKLVSLQAGANGASAVFAPTSGIGCGQGLYASLGGAGAEVTVLYR